MSAPPRLRMGLLEPHALIDDMPTQNPCCSSRRRRAAHRRCGTCSISAAARRLDPLVALALAAVLRRRAAAVGELTALDDDDERDRLRLGVHRTGDDRFDANAESAPGDALGRRDRKCAGTRREQRVGVGAGSLTSGSTSGAGGSGVGSRKPFGMKLAN